MCRDTCTHFGNKATKFPWKFKLPIKPHRYQLQIPYKPVVRRCPGNCVVKVACTYESSRGVWGHTCHFGVVWSLRMCAFQLILFVGMACTSEFMEFAPSVKFDHWHTPLNRSIQHAECPYSNNYPCHI